MAVLFYPCAKVGTLLSVSRKFCFLIDSHSLKLNAARGFYKNYTFFRNNTTYSVCGGKGFLHLATSPMPGPHNCKFNYSTEIPEQLSAEELFSEKDEESQLIPRSLRIGSMPHQVLIIHPYIKWGAKKQRDTTPDLELEEAASLIKTLENWRVVSTKKVALMSFDNKTLFNSGQLETIKETVKKNEHISAVFINLKSLKLEQHLLLEESLNVPIFDRYSIVVNIFKKHAVSKEAKLQVALAEVPYIRSRVRGINEIECGDIIKNTGIGSNESYLTKRLKILSFHEQKLKRELQKLKTTRNVLRNKRKDLQFPVVAVVGYTNAGKTSLIKCLTSEKRMEPKDKLFATLDVTFHAGVLPCNLKVLYIDTIGFITDIPTNLLEPFVVTLEDAMLADLIIHVQDISHPNHLKQKAHVLNTLKTFNLKENLMNSIISVGNKCDKGANIESFDKDTLITSCTKQIGLDELELAIQNALVENLQLQNLRIRVENGGKEYQWLQKEVAISDYTVDENNQQFIILDVIISKAKLEQFKHYFIKQ